MMRPAGLVKKFALPATALFQNPVLVKELRTRMRGRRTFLVVTLHLGILALIVSAAYLTISYSLDVSANLSERRTFAKLIFGLIVGLEMAMLAFTTPALSAGAIANERERQTYDLVRTTLLKPSSFVLGKFLSGFSLATLLLFTALPMLSPAFIIGGVTMPEIFISVLCLEATAALFCAVGIFVSSFARRTLWATVLAYGYAILQIFGLPLIYAFVLTLAAAGLSNSSIMESPNLLFSILAFLAWLALSITPTTALLMSVIAYANDGSLWAIELPLNPSITVWVVSPWVIYVSLATLLSLLLLWISVRRIKQLEI